MNATDQTGQQGEDITHLGPGEGEALWVLTQLITFKRRDATYALVEGRDLPHGMSAPPPHIHHTQDEAFYVLEGEYEFVSGDRVITAGPGSFVHVPKGTVHTLRNASDRPGRTLTVVTPPGPVEQFFSEVGVPATDLSTPPQTMPDMQKLMDSARRHELEFVLPGGAPRPA